MIWKKIKDNSGYIAVSLTVLVSNSHIFQNINYCILYFGLGCNLNLTVHFTV